MPFPFFTWVPQAISISSHALERVWVLCYDRQSVNQSVLEQSTHLGLTTRFLIPSDYPLWREDGSVVNKCCWPSPAQSFSSQSPVRLVIIVYCLTFETSFFVASCDSQGYGGGIRPSLHEGSYLGI
jgi:hypothetical protein